MPNPGAHFYFYGNVEWMAWNAALAVLPFLLALILFKKNRKITPLWLIVFAIYFAFLPNAPYILTDIVHLYSASVYAHSNRILFVTIWQYLLFVLLGAYLFGDAYARLEHFAAKRFKVTFIWLRLVVFVFMSTGVYLGRFLRLNSWDFVARPMMVLKSLTHLISFHAFVYIGLFTILLYMIYFLFERLHQNLHPHLHTHKK